MVPDNIRHRLLSGLAYVVAVCVGVRLAWWVVAPVIGPLMVAALLVVIIRFVLAGGRLNRR